MFLLKKLTKLLIETYAYGMNKDLVCKKEEIKYKNIVKQYKNVYL